MSRLPVTERETLHAAQAELERLMDSDDMRYMRPEARQAIRLLVVQAGRFAEAHDQLQDIQRRMDRLDNAYYDGEG